MYVNSTFFQTSHTEYKHCHKKDYLSLMNPFTHDPTVSNLIKQKSNLTCKGEL